MDDLNQTRPDRHPAQPKGVPVYEMTTPATHAMASKYTPTPEEVGRYCAAMARLADRAGFPALGGAYRFAASVQDAGAALHSTRFNDRRPKGA